jgi:hypothetical protein
LKKLLWPYGAGIREGIKKKELGKSLTETICENLDPFLSFMKWQNNPRYGNLSRNFHIHIPDRLVNPSSQPDRFFPVFLTLPLAKISMGYLIIVKIDGLLGKIKKGCS